MQVMNEKTLAHIDAKRFLQAFVRLLLRRLEPVAQKLALGLVNAQPIKCLN